MPFRCRLAAETKYFFRISQLREAIERRSNRIEGVAPAERLRDDVVSADQFDHRADCASGNDPGSVDRRLEQDVLAAEETMDFMRDRSALERNMHEVLLGLLNGLGNGDRDFGGFPLADSYPSVTVADHDQRTKIKPLAALHDLRHAVDEDDFVLQA